MSENFARAFSYLLTGHENIYGWDIMSYAGNRYIFINQGDQSAKEFESEIQRKGIESIPTFLEKEIEKVKSLTIELEQLASS